MAHPHLVVVAVVLLLTVARSADVTQEDGVLVLTDRNFDQAVKDNPLLMVEFYAPWCGHCKALASEYIEAAKQLKGTTIKLAKVDGTVEKELVKKHNVEGYPTLKFFKNGKPFEFKAGHKAADIVNWLKRKAASPAPELTTASDAEAFAASDEVVAIGFFKNLEGEKCKKFLAVADDIDYVKFGVSSKSEAYNALDVKSDGVVLFKKFDEKKDVYDGDYSEKSLKQWLHVNSLPLVVDFNQDTAERIFAGHIASMVLLFDSAQREGFADEVKEFRMVAKKFKGKLLFVHINTDIEDNKRILEFFAINPKQLPTVWIVSIKPDIVKYKPSFKGFSMSDVTKFAQEFIDKKLKPYLLSQELPSDWDQSNVKVLVQKNFKKVVEDPKKNVLVMFYAPWCQHCKQLEPVFIELAEHARHFDSDLVVTKMDATLNELDDIKITKFPTIKFFPKGSKKGIDYVGERTLEALQDFVKSGGKQDATSSKQAGKEEL